MMGVLLRRRLLRLVVGAVLLGASASWAHVPDVKVFDKPAPVLGVNAAVADVEARYREALEKLDLAAFRALHHKDVVIFESGHKNVGWADYEKNHLQPELDEMKSFRFTKWESAARTYGDTALVVADIGYVIELKDGKRHEASGVATLVLRPAGKSWEIVHSHWSTARAKS